MKWKVEKWIRYVEEITEKKICEVEKVKPGDDVIIRLSYYILTQLMNRTFQHYWIGDASVRKETLRKISYNIYLYRVYGGDICFVVVYNY